MYVITRIWETKPGEARRAATLVAKIGQEYEKAGQRSNVQVSFNGRTLPGETDRVYMRWTADVIDSPYRRGSERPASLGAINAKLREITVRNWIEFEELLTPEKWQE